MAASAGYLFSKCYDTLDKTFWEDLVKLAGGDAHIVRKSVDKNWDCCKGSGHTSEFEVDPSPGYAGDPIRNVNEPTNTTGTCDCAPVVRRKRE